MTAYLSCVTPVRFLLLGAFVSVSLSACATISSGEYAHAMDTQGHLASSPRTPLGLKISGAEVGDLSSPYFGLVALTLENDSPDWVRIRKLSVSFGGADQDASVLIPWGADIASWEHAIEERNAVRSYNASSALAAIAVAGALVAAVGHHKAAGAVGGLVAAGAVAALTARAVSEDVSAIESVPLFPDTHLLSVPFAVPPGLFSKKWILLNTPSAGPAACVKAMLIEYETERGQKEQVWLPFRRPYSGSEWQRHACSERLAQH